LSNSTLAILENGGLKPNPLANLDYQGPQEKLPDEINEFFTSVSAQLPKVNADILANLTDDYSSEFIVDPAEVENRLAKINISKAPGPGNLPSWFLRDFAPFLAQPLAAIFNASIREGYMPPIWKAAEVVPVPKTSRPQSIQNDLRPISLLPCVAKVFESIIDPHLFAILEPSLDPEQFGCRRERSTTHALVAMTHTWQTELDQGGVVRALFVDFRKAFDLVNHNILLHKLLDRKVPHCLIKWFFSYLDQRSQRVRVGDNCSALLFLNGAMPQGSWLDPLTFLFLINDLHVDCLTHKYVDDTTLTELLHNNGDQCDMQSFFQQLLNWATNNDMIVNFTKTKEMIMGPPSKTANLIPLSTDNGYVEQLTSFKLLSDFTS